MTNRYPLVLNGTTIQETQAGDGIQLPTALDIAYGGTGQTTANSAFNALAPSQTGNSGKYLTTDGSNTSWAANPLGTVTSVAMTTPTGLTVSGSPITTNGTLAVDLQTGYSIPTTASQTNWDTAYSERQQWNGSATNLVAATGRTSLGLGTIATQDASAVAITGGSITGITDLAVADGGTGASTAAGAMVNLLPSYTGNSNKRLSLNSTASGLEWVTDGGGTVTSVDVSGGTTGLSFSGGPITTSGSITLSGILDVDNGGTGAIDAPTARTNLGAAASATTVSAGTGLSGGGDLSANRTFAIANTAVTAGSYGSASNTLAATVNAQGQLTALSATPIAIANTQVSGLGTMSTQNSNAVTITGGSITGITDLAIADGGTGASNAADARSNLGLGSAAVLTAGAANGVATLDAGGTVPLSQIPASIQGGVSYQGAWNASTNTPTLTSSVGTKGYYYVVSVAGSTNLNGITDWLVGDWAIFNGTAWEQIDNTDAVASVNGYTGVVVLAASDVGAPPTSRTISAGTGLSGGGDLSTNRTLSIANTTVTAASYGSASAVPTFTVNGQGQLTAASNTTIAIANTQVSGLGTMSTQAASSVAITGGSITGITDLAVADGGTGSSTAQGAINNLAGAVTSGSYLRGNGTNVVMSTIQAADVPTLNQNTTGTASNVTGTVAIANGGTGATTAGAALTALGAYPSSNPNGYTSNTGTVTSVAGTGTVNGLTLSGTVTSSGNLTLGGTLSLVSPPAIGSTTPNTGGFSTLSIAGAAAPVTASNERLTFSNTYDATILGKLYGATSVNQKFLNSGWNLASYGTGGAGYMVNGVNGIYSPSGGGQYISSASFTSFGTLSIDGFTNTSPTFTEYARINASGIAATTGGATSDPYGAISVSGSANANNYSYFGLTRAGNIGAGFGLTGTTGALGLSQNAFWFGGSSGAGPTGVMTSAYIAFNSSTFQTAGAIACGTQFNGAGTGLTGTAASLSIGGNAATATSATTATTATTANALNTANNYQVNSLGVGTAGSGTAGEIRATNNVTAYYSSDIKFKENVQDIPNAAATAAAIGGKLFDWKDSYIEEHGGEDGYFVQKHDFGIIAQDALKHFPVAVRTRPDGSLAVDYEKLSALALAAISEQELRIAKLESLVAKLIEG